MNTLGARIRELRRTQNLTQEEFSLSLRVNRATLASWEIDRAIPDISMLQRLADYFGVSMDELLGRPSEKQQNKAGPPNALPVEFVEIPILGRIHAGAPTWIEQNIEGYTHINKGQFNGGEYFALRVQGDCMVPSRIYPGDLVIVRRQPTVENGEIAVVYWNGEEEGHLRRVRRAGQQLLLTADNPAYTPVLLPPERITILGKVVEVKFRPEGSRPTPKEGT